MIVPMSIKSSESYLGLILQVLPRNVLLVGEAPLVGERGGSRGVSLAQTALSDHAGTGGDTHLETFASPGELRNVQR